MYEVEKKIYDRHALTCTNNLKFQHSYNYYYKYAHKYKFHKTFFFMRNTLLYIAAHEIYYLIDEVVHVFF